MVVVCVGVVLLLLLLLLLAVLKLLRRHRGRRRRRRSVGVVVIVRRLLRRQRRRRRRVTRVKLLVLPLSSVMLLLLWFLCPSCSAGGLRGGHHQRRLGSGRPVALLPSRGVGDGRVHRRQLPRMHQTPVRGALAPPSASSRPRGRFCHVPSGHSLAQVGRRAGADFRQVVDEFVGPCVFDHDGAQEALRGPAPRRGLGLPDGPEVLPRPVARPAAEAAVDELLFPVVELVELLLLLLILLLLMVIGIRLHHHLLLLLLALRASSRVGRVCDFLQGRWSIRRHRSSRREKKARAAG